MKAIYFIISLIVLSSNLHGQTSNEIISKGNQYYQQSQFDLAEIQYRKVLEADPKNTTAEYNLANAFQKQKKYDEAIKLLETLCTSTNAKDLKSSAYYNEGVANTKNQNLEASIESYKKALRLNPNDQDARENLQKALLELRKKQQQSPQKPKPQSNMSQKEAEQKLKLLEQKEKELQQRMQSKTKQEGSRQVQDW